MDSKPHTPSLREIVSKMSVAQHLQIMREYDEYEKTGTIGDTLLRSTAESLAVGSAKLFALDATMVAFETYRYIAKCQQRHYAGYAWAMN